MTIVCNSCNNDNPDGTVNCIFCGQDLLNPTVMPNVIQGVAVKVQAHAPVGIGSSGAANAVSVLIPIIGGAEEPTRAITLPAGKFRFMMGRTQLDEGLKPQIDLQAKFPDVVETANGFLVSRRTGYVRRDPVTDAVFFQHHPDSNVEVLIQGPRDTDPQILLPGNEEILESGSILTIGKNHLYIEFIAR